MTFVPLSQDEDVQELISSAKRGQLVVGMYRHQPSPAPQPPTQLAVDSGGGPVDRSSPIATRKNLSEEKGKVCEVWSQSRAFLL